MTPDTMNNIHQSEREIKKTESATRERYDYTTKEKYDSTKPSLDSNKENHIISID